MTVESIIAINFLKNNEIINKNKVPILYFWNDDDSLTEELRSSEELQKYIFSNFSDSYSYLIGRMSIAKYNGEEERFEELHIKVQELFNIDFMTKHDSEFWVNFIYNDFINLDSHSDGLDYENKIEHIQAVYEKIKRKHPNRVNKDVVVNYIFSKLNENQNINIENTNFIIQKLKEIIK